MYHCKFFGPHISVLYGRQEQMERLVPYKLRPSCDELPSVDTWEVSRWELGTQNFESVAGATAAIDYIASLGGTAGAGGEGAAGAAGAGRRAAIARAWARLAVHEGKLTARMLAGLASMGDRVRLFGLNASHFDSEDLSLAAAAAAAGGGQVGDPAAAAAAAAAALAAARTPTFALHKDGLTPEELAAALTDRGIYCASGNFYALELSTEVLGVEEAGGFCRLGFLHYNTESEVEKVLEAIEAA
eukprot:g2519.t1